jgi:hypothetical protein
MRKTLIQSFTFHRAPREAKQSDTRYKRSASCQSRAFISPKRRLSGKPIDHLPLWPRVPACTFCMPPPVGLTMIFDIAPTMLLTGYYRIRDPAAFIMHGNPRAKDIVCFVLSTTASSCLADSPCCLFFLVVRQLSFFLSSCFGLGCVVVSGCGDSEGFPMARRHGMFRCIGFLDSDTTIVGDLATSLMQSLEATQEISIPYAIAAAKQSILSEYIRQWYTITWDHVPTPDVGVPRG